MKKRYFFVKPEPVTTNIFWKIFFLVDSLHIFTVSSFLSILWEVISAIKSLKNYNTIFLTIISSQTRLRI